MWEMSDPIAEVGRDVCPDPEAVHEPNRFKTGIDIERQKARLKAQTPEMPKEEKKKISGLSQLRDAFNDDAGYGAYHVDHVVPIARGGLHHPENLRIIFSEINIKKEARI